MTLRNLIITLMCAGAISASAVPAKRGEVFMMTQPDGTKVALTLEGDEHFHHYVTPDGLIVLNNGSSFNYATVAADGSLKDSGVMVHDATLRTASESELVATLSPETVKGALMKTAQAVRAAKLQKAAEDELSDAPLSRSNSKDGIGRLQTSFPTTGNVKTIVILAEFSDVPFTTPNPNEYFTRMLNEEGFSDNGAYGSARDYYLASSNGKFIGQFDVYGPVKLPQTQAYYGGNDVLGNDLRPSQMLIDALKELDSEVDYSQYDLDEDRFIDNVFVFYSGMGESHGGAPETIWPHQGNLPVASSSKFDNVYARRYACTSELQKADMTDGIGTFCHEFGHVLGIPDLYDIYNTGAAYTPNDYSVMDSGSYCGNSMRMPLFSAFERNALGWMGEDLVEITGPASCTLESLENSGKAYLISTDRANEFFIFENRQRTGWDLNLPGHGMLVWHIDFVMSRWNNNTANTVENHQLIDLVEANGRYASSRLTQMNYPFPGNSKKTQFVYGGTPNFIPWSGEDLGLPITDIKETNGVITFNVAGGGDDPASVTDVVAEADLEVSINGGVINAVSNAPICISDISGRVIAQSGGGQLTTPSLATGIYIVASKGASRKVAIK